MNYCVNCNLKYSSAEFVCAECLEPLAKAKSTSFKGAAKPDDSWIIIGDIDSDYANDLAKGALEAGNVPSVIVNSDNSKEALANGFLLSETDLEVNRSIIMVPKEYEFRAANVLQELLELQINEFKSTHKRSKN